MLQAGRELLLLRLPVRLIDLNGLARGESFEQQLVDALLVPPLLVGPDQVQNVFPDAAESALGSSFLHEGLHRFRQRNFYRLHTRSSTSRKIPHIRVTWGKVAG